MLSRHKAILLLWQTAAFLGDPYCILYTVYCILHTVYFIVHTVYFTPHTVYCILHTAYCILYTRYFVLYCYRKELAERSRIIVTIEQQWPPCWGLPPFSFRLESAFHCSLVAPGDFARLVSGYRLTHAALLGDPHWKCRQVVCVGKFGKGLGQGCAPIIFEARNLRNPGSFQPNPHLNPINHRMA